MTNIVLVQPSGLPLSLDEVKTYLRIGTDGDDNMLMLFLNAAIEVVETRNQIALLSRKLRQSISAVGIMRAQRLCGKTCCKPSFRPDFKPVTAIDAVRTLKNGAMAAALGLVTLEDNLFCLNGYSEGLEIDYFAGFADAAAVPYRYKLEILEEIGRAIQNRDNEGETSVTNNGVRL